MMTSSNGNIFRITGHLCGNSPVTCEFYPNPLPPPPPPHTNTPTPTPIHPSPHPHPPITPLTPAPSPHTPTHPSPPPTHPPLTPHPPPTHPPPPPPPPPPPHTHTHTRTHKGQWCGALMFSLIFAWINGSINNRDDGDLGRNRAHYDIIVMAQSILEHDLRQCWPCFLIRSGVICDQVKSNFLPSIEYHICCLCCVLALFINM